MRFFARVYSEFWYICKHHNLYLCEISRKLHFFPFHTDSIDINIHCPKREYKHALLIRLERIVPFPQLRQKRV